MKPTILAFVQCYLPGYKFGGPVRTISNLVDHLGNEFNFRIVTSDRDLFDTKPYPDIAVDEWNTIGKAMVFYMSETNRSLNAFSRLINTIPHDVLYLNSYFQPVFTLRPLLLRRLGMIPKKPVIVAPRGEFSPGALALKARKKRLYMAGAKAIGIYRDLIWQASNEYEAENIRGSLGDIAKKIVIAANLPSLPHDRGAESVTRVRRCNEALNVVFLSRISPMKNLEFALRVLSSIRAPVQFDMYGPIENRQYWRKCELLLSDLPRNISANYRGSIGHSEVQPILSSHDLLFLPTKGENYGHVIMESISVGTPVLISNTTPWRDLEAKGIGWDLPLDDPGPFIDCIQYAAALSEQSYLHWRERVRAFGLRQIIDTGGIDGNRNLFRNISAGETEPENYTNKDAEPSGREELISRR